MSLGVRSVLGALLDDSEEIRTEALGHVRQLDDALRCVLFEESADGREDRLPLR